MNVDMHWISKELAVMFRPDLNNGPPALLNGQSAITKLIPGFHLDVNKSELTQDIRE